MGYSPATRFHNVGQTAQSHRGPVPAHLSWQAVMVAELRPTSVGAPENAIGIVIAQQNQTPL